LYIAASNQFTETLSITSNRQIWPSVATCRLLLLTRGVAFHPAPGQTEIYMQLRVGHLVISLGSTKPPVHPEDGDTVSSQNIGKPSHLDVAVYPRKFH